MKLETGPLIHFYGVSDLKLSELHIDGFGIFSNKHIEGLCTGINVLYGANEFGKSTLLAFIKRILFGFPRSSANINSYPAIYGGSYGGRLIGYLDNGESITVSRTQGTHGGPVTISTGSYKLTGQDELNKLLGYITPKFYENVYAISLDELQELRSLNEDEVRSRIYGAGLGLGRLSITQIEDVFRKKSESLFKPPGSAQKMPTLYREIRQLEKDMIDIQKLMGKYDEKVGERDKLTEDVDGVQEKLREINEQKISLQNKQKLYSTFCDYEDAQAELANLEEVPSFSEDSLEQLEQLKSSINGLDEQIREKEDDIRGFQVTIDGLIYDERILSCEAPITELQRLSEKYISAKDDIESEKVRRTNLESTITHSIGQIRRTWNIESIKNFILSHAQQEQIYSYISRFDEAEANISNAENKLGYHRETRDAMSPKLFTVGDFYKYAIYIVAFLGLIGSILGAVFAEWWLLSLSVIIFLLGASVTLIIRRGGQIQITDLTENNLTKRLDEKLSEQEKLDTEWHSFLASIDLDENLSPNGAKEVIESIKNIRSNLLLLNDLDSRIERMQNTIDQVTKLHNEVAQCIDQTLITQDIGANIEVMVKELNVAKGKKLQKESADHNISEITQKMSRLKNSRDDIERKLREYLASFAIADEDDFRRKFAIFIKRNELDRSINEYKRSMQTTVGIGEHFNNFIESISLTSPEEIQSQLDELGSQLEEISEKSDNMNRTIGELNVEIEQISSSNDLLTKQSEAELRKQQLRDFSRDWIKSQIGLFVLESAITKYERTRQPEVIIAAEGFFGSITGDNYPTIIKRIDSEDLEILHTSGSSKGLMEMSRGTREQLYLAMRLGLIQEYEKRSESMPVIMDDILANFDDDRGPLAIQSMKKFAENRQVIVLTCHKNTYDIYRELGANQINLV